MRALRPAAVLLAAACVAGLAAGAARADGDPASDYLVVRQVFFPYDAKVPRPAQQKLLAAVHSANTQGFDIKVALIASSYDLGSVTALWRKPRQYARFLSLEDSFYFKSRLVVVMPNGLGFHFPRHDSAAAYRLISNIPVTNSPAGLANAATTAVERLAKASGVQVSTAAAAKEPTPAQQSNHDRVVIIVAVLAALVVGGALRFLLRRRRSARVGG
jgi:hypothetical protein